MAATEQSQRREASYIGVLARMSDSFLMSLVKWPVISTRSISFQEAVPMHDHAAASSLTLAIDRTGNAAAVRCCGRLVAGVNDRFYFEVSPLIPSSKRILLDFTDLTQMDSSGLGALVRVYASARSATCTLQLFNIGKPIRQLLSATRLLSVFEVIGNNDISGG